MTEQYTYYAFISYKREDEKWARWIQKKLERYTIPSVIRQGDSRMPRQIRPVFRDNTDLTGGLLIKGLKSELLNSRYLIVICSPNATKSEWVNQEIKTFIETGRLEQIIPFIVAGKPNAKDPEKECFPQALRELPADKELLGINIQELGKNAAFVRLAATMLQVRFDALWQRHRRQQLRRRILFGCIAALMVLIGLFIWDYKRPSYQYFADYTDCFGVPEGILPLTERQVSHRYRSYRFEYRRTPFGEPGAYRRRIVKLSLVNSALLPQDIGETEQEGRYPIQEIEYNKETGVVSRINYLDRQGNVQLRHVLSERNGVQACVADIVASQEQRGVGFASTTPDGNAGTAAITRLVYERNAKGYITRITYHANNDSNLSRSAISDAGGVYGMQILTDSLGRRLRVDFLNLEGGKTSAHGGVATREYQYDSYGNLSRVACFDKEGKRILNDSFYAVSEGRSDAWGNLLEASYYGTDGAPCITAGGYARKSAVYDEKGFVTDYSYWGTDGLPCINNEGYAGETLRYDKWGRALEISFRDTDGKPCLGADGYASVRFSYDRAGNTTEESFLDLDGQACLCAEGYARRSCSYDMRGFMTQTAYFGTDGAPLLYHEGYTELRLVRDSDGHWTERSYWGTDGKPCLAKDGSALAKARYDERGNQTEVCYFGVDGLPCLNAQGYAILRTAYDEQGNPTEYAYFDADGQPCRSEEGIARMTIRYDASGNGTEVACFGPDGAPCLNAQHFVRASYQYDEKGRQTGVSFFGADNLPCPNHEGSARLVSSFEEDGHSVSVVSYDTRGEKNLNKYGFCRIQRIFDANGMEVERRFFDTQDKAVDAMGYHRSVTTYDQRRRQTGIVYYDSKNRELANLIRTEMVTSVTGAAAQQAGLAVGSMLLQWNGWKLGDSLESLQEEHRKSRYGQKDLYYMGPDGNIVHVFVDTGLVGIGFQYYNIPQATATDWQQALNYWGKEN